MDGSAVWMTDVALAGTTSRLEKVGCCAID
jgi:hypothetical protein